MGSRYQKRKGKTKMTDGVVPQSGGTGANPPTGFDLRLTSLEDASGIPTAGKSLIIVATVKKVLHFRIFDGDGRMVVDTDETKLATQAGPIDELRKQLENVGPPHELTESEKARVIAAVTAIVGPTSSLAHETRRAGDAHRGGARGQGWLSQMGEWIKSNFAAGLVGLLAVALLSGLGYVIYNSGKDGDFLGRLREQDYARGLITFIISISTIILGFVLVIGSLFMGSSLKEDEYRRGREVFTGLMGVLGTIVGFYFGASQQTTHVLQLAPIDIADLGGGAKRVTTFATGGTPPYRYTVQFSGKDAPAIQNKVSETGWIRENFPANATLPVEVQVKDREDRPISIRRDQ
jgi:hypothetical protein